MRPLRLGCDVPAAFFQTVEFETVLTKGESKVYARFGGEFPGICACLRRSARGHGDTASRAGDSFHTGGKRYGKACHWSCRYHDWSGAGDACLFGEDLL